jgi:hypothetical protein
MSWFIVSGRKRKGLFVTGNNGFLSTRQGFLTLRKSGNNTGNNGSMAGWRGVLEPLYCDFRGVFHNK